MAEAKNTVDSIREWVVDHKLRTVGNLSPSLSVFVYYLWVVRVFGFDFDGLNLMVWIKKL